MTATADGRRLPHRTVAREWRVGAGVAALLAAAALLSIFGFTLAGRHTFEWVDHTRDVVASSQHLLLMLTDAETGQRGFLLTGDQRYLEPYNQAFSQVNASTALLRALTRDNQRQQERVDQLQSLASEKLEELANTIRARQDRGEEAAQEIVRTDRGRITMEAIRTMVARIEADENTLLVRRMKQRRASLAWLWALASVGVVFGLALVTLGFRSELESRRATHETNSQFHALADGIPQLCWMADQEGWIFWYNQRWYDYTGTTPEQMTGWGWQSVHDPEKLPQVMEKWQASIATGTPFEMVFPIKDANGDFRPFLTRVVPIRDRDGVLQRWFGTNTDIGEQRRFANALQESEERLRLAQQVAGVGTFDWDIRTGVNRWTPELEAMYGLQPGSFALTTPAWEQLVHPSDRTHAVDLVQRSMQTGLLDGEWRVIWPDASVRWLTGRGRVFKDESGAPIRMLGVNIDITERKLAEQALRESELRYSTLTEALPAIVYTTLPTGKTDFVNSRWQNFTGLTFTESVLVGFDEPIHPEDRRAIGDIWAEAKRTELPFEAEFRLRRSDGIYRWFRSRVVPLRNEQSALVKWLGISSDVDDEKKAEDRLRQSQKMEAVGRLAGGVAHDFNNLLTGISGFNSMLIESIEQDSELLGFAREVQKAADKATALTRQLLSFSRREISKPKILDMNAAILDMHTLLTRVIGEDIEITLDLSPEPMWVRVDPVQLDQVIMNLAVNARDAMAEGGRLLFTTFTAVVSAEAAVESMGNPGRYIVLQVADSGCGMNAETKARLFEPFFTTKEQGKGTGLGLSTVYGVVQQNGGFISVESEPGQGAIFAVHLPQTLRTGDVDIPEQTSTVQIGNGGGTIVLAEDDDIVRQLAAALLRKQGFRVLEAASPGLALKLVQNFVEPILALVTDVLMPEMRGPELAKKIRELRPGLPVLFVSGFSDRTFLNPASLDGVVVLQKPFTSAELYAALRVVIGKGTGSNKI